MNLAARYAKAAAALLGGLSAWGITATADGRYSAPELWGVVGILGTVVTVALVPNGVPEDEQPED